MNTKRSLLTSCMALFLCFAMLLGTTFAWFTDSVTSSGNKIQSGTLKLDLSVLTEGTTDDWVSIKDEQSPLYNYEKWEPGYTDVTILRVENEGSLALKWVARFASSAPLSKLAEVIDVYVKPGATEYPADRTDLTGWQNVGTLDNFVNSISETTYGFLKGGETATLGIALKMQEEAGNEYQGLDLGSFDIRIVATQATYESDSFDDQYDVNAEWPVFTGGVSASVAVTPNAEGKLDAATTITSSDGRITATLPAGVQLADGATSITLSVSQVEDSQANVTLSDSEQMLPVDVHIEGVADNNTVAIPVTVQSLLPVGLNIGNYQLYHVENGVTNEMTLRADGQTPVHNNFDYDVNTGDVVMYLASFSEIALVADVINAWGGGVDHSWYIESTNELTIVNADQLWSFSQIVGGMADNIAQDSFEGKTVVLKANINLGYNGTENYPIFYPIGYYNSEYTYEKNSQATERITSGFMPFEGTFDGNGNTISNIYQNTWDMKGDNEYYTAQQQCFRDGMGLFGKVYGGTVKNLTVSNFSSDGEFTTTGVIAAYADSGNDKSAIFENIAIVNCNPRVYNIGNGGIVGSGGWYSRSDATASGNPIIFKNITVDSTNKISALWGSWDVACGGIMGRYYPDSNCGVQFENCHVAAQIDVYNDVCGNYQYYWYRYAGMMIGTINQDKTENGYTVPSLDGITTVDCTVHFGDWNDYYYCELVANSLASYTHDHQMSRLTEITHLGEIYDGSSWLKAGNFLLIDGDTKTCYHITEDDNGNLSEHKHSDAGEETVDGKVVLKEDKQIVYLPFNQVYQGSGWGIKSIALTEQAISGLTVLDRDFANSVDKFEPVDCTPEVIVAGTTVKIGDLFKAAELLHETLIIDSANTQVFVSPVYGTDSTVSATFVPNTTNWAEGTLNFSGVGPAKITITDYKYCREATIEVYVVAAGNVAVSVNGHAYETTNVALNKTLSNEVNNTVNTNACYYDILVYTKAGYNGTVELNNNGVAVVLDKYGVIKAVYDGANDANYASSYDSTGWENTEAGETLVIFTNRGTADVSPARQWALDTTKANVRNSVGKYMTIAGLGITFATHDHSNDCEFCGGCQENGCDFANTCSGCTGVTITNGSTINTHKTANLKNISGVSVGQTLNDATSFLYYTYNSQTISSVKTNLSGSAPYGGVAIILNKYGEIVRIYDGVNGKYFDETYPKGATNVENNKVTPTNYRASAIASLAEGETILYALKETDSSPRYQFLLNNRVIGAIVSISGVTFTQRDVTGDNDGATPW